MIQNLTYTVFRNLFIPPPPKKSQPQTPTTSPSELHSTMVCGKGELDDDRGGGADKGMRGLLSDESGLSDGISACLHNTLLQYLRNTPPASLWAKKKCSYTYTTLQWSHEVNHFCRGIPIVLVGCKTDLRKDKEHLRKLRSAQQEPITYIQGEEACRRMNADIYLECSAKFRENVEDVFRETANIALNAIKKAKRQTKSRPCAIL
ncbi:rho-related GTP-binding protein RhoF isoform X2 [Podarcis muralis]